MPYTSILKVPIRAAFDCSSHQLDLAQGGGVGWGGERGYPHHLNLSPWNMIGMDIPQSSLWNLVHNCILRNNNLNIILTINYQCTALSLLSTVRLQYDERIE